MYDTTLYLICTDSIFQITYLVDHLVSCILEVKAFHTYTPLFDHNEWKFIDHIILHIISAMHITEHLSIACKRISLPVKYLLSVSLKGKGGRYLFQYQIKRTRVTKQTIRKNVFILMQTELDKLFCALQTICAESLHFPRVKELQSCERSSES